MAYEEEPVHVSGHRLAVDTISECLRAALRSCPALPSPPTPNLGPCINHWARRTESQRWVVGGRKEAEEGGRGGGRNEAHFTASSPEAIWTERNNKIVSSRK